MTPVKAPETAATRAAAIAMTTVGELSGEDTAILVFIPPRSASLAWLSTSIARRPRHGITASPRLPWTLPAVPTLPLAGSAACWLATGTAAGGCLGR